MQLRRHKVKQHMWKAKSSSFPADGHQAILNKVMKSQRQTESGRTLTIRISHNRSTALERTVINYWEFKSVLRVHNPRPRFCCDS